MEFVCFVFEGRGWMLSDSLGLARNGYSEYGGDRDGSLCNLLVSNVCN